MKRLSQISIAAALLALPALAYLLVPDAAVASSQKMCKPQASNAAPGPSRYVPTSGTAYTLDNAGCAIIQAADLGDARAAGFVQPGGTQSVVVNHITATDFTSIVLPPGAYIHNIVIQNNTANAVTGGVKIGTTSGGTDVVAAQTCAANCLQFVSDSGLAKRVFSSSASQTLSVAAVSAFNSADLAVTVIYSFF